MQNRINEGRSHGYTDRSIASELAVSARLGRYERPWQPVTRTQPDKLVTNVLNENSPKGGGGMVSGTRILAIVCGGEGFRSQTWQRKQMREQTRTVAVSRVRQTTSADAGGSASRASIQSRDATAR